MFAGPVHRRAIEEGLAASGVNRPDSSEAQVLPELLAPTTRKQNPKRITNWTLILHATARNLRRVQPKGLRIGNRHVAPAEWQSVVFAGGPGGELVGVVGSAGMAGVALSVDCQKLAGGQISDEPVASACGGEPVWIIAGVANGSHISLHRPAAVIEQLS